MRLAFETAVECTEWETHINLDLVVAECLEAALKETSENLPEGAEVSFLFCDDSRIRELNRHYRGKDKPTNVLSFPSPRQIGSTRFLGDIALAYETIAREAREQEKSLDRHSRHMIVHGFLHLLGYDHEEAHDAEEMEAAEIRILQKLGIANPYCDANQSETDPDDGA